MAHVTMKARSVALKDCHRFAALRPWGSCECSPTTCIAKSPTRICQWQRAQILQATRPLTRIPLRARYVSGTKSYSPIPCSTRNTAGVSPPLVTR
jgi:hypothetical protein